MTGTGFSLPVICFLIHDVTAQLHAGAAACLRVRSHGEAGRVPPLIG
jgi:hypothetical protein